MNGLFKKALVSEKSFREVTAGKVTFVVDKGISKEEIAATCESLFKVTVLDVNTLNFIGKIKRTKKSTGKRSDYKKAVITLKPGDKIDLFEIEKEDDKKNKKTKIKDQTEKVEDKKLAVS